MAYMAQDDKSTNDQTPRPQGNAIKDPEDWTTGDEPMTGAQRSYLNTLATEAGEEVEEDLTKAEASKKIDELQQKTGRGVSK
jgi:hypothetical protein